MEHSREYIIQFIGLKDGEHEFEYPIGLEFIGSFNNDELSGAQLNAFITLNKKPEMLEMHIRVEGNVTVACDRCNGALTLDLVGQQRQVFKVSEREHYDNEEIVAISANDHEIDVSGYIYECINLALPLRRVHEVQECDPDALKALEEVSRKEEQESDPRWEALKAL